MNTSHRRSAPLLAVLLLAAALAGCSAVAEGRRAPALRGDSWLALAGSGDSAVVEGNWSLVVFFRGDFVRCHEQVPEVKALRESFGPRGLVVVGVTPEEPAAAEAFIGRHAIPWPVLADGGRVQRDFGLVSIWENRYYLLAPDGTVVAQDDLPAIRRILEKNLPAAGPKDGGP